MTMLQNLPQLSGLDGILINHQGGQSIADQLNRDERALLDRDVFGVLTAEQGYLRRLFERNRVEIQATLAIAKFALQATFKGIGASDNEIGVRLIRAGDLMRTTGATEAPNNDWVFSFGTAGNNNWIGFGTSNGTAINIDKRICIIWLGVAFTDGGAPVVEDLYTQVGGLTLPIETIRHAWLADNENRVRVAALRPKVLTPKQTLYVQARTSYVGANELVALGVTFGLGSFLRLLAPTAVQT